MCCSFRCMTGCGIGTAFVVALAVGVVFIWLDASHRVDSKILLIVGICLCGAAAIGLLTTIFVSAMCCCCRTSHTSKHKSDQKQDQKVKTVVVVDGSGKATATPIQNVAVHNHPVSGPYQPQMYPPLTIAPITAVTQPPPPQPLLAKHPLDNIIIPVDYTPAGKDAAGKELCSSCGLRPANTMILECGHLCACEECARRVIRCPMCGTVAARTMLAS